MVQSRNVGVRLVDSAQRFSSAKTIVEAAAAAAVKSFLGLLMHFPLITMIPFLLDRLKSKKRCKW